MLQTQLKSLVVKRSGIALWVWGETGIGKTYAIRQVLANLPCESAYAHANTSLASLVTLLPETAKLPAWAELSLTRLGQGENLDSRALSAALSSKLVALAPFVLCLEDCHEVGSERLELIKILAQMIKHSKGVGLIISSRTKPPAAFKSLRLEPLNQSASDELLRAELKAELPKDALRWIYSKAAGNPLYTLEYLRFLSRQGFLWSDGKAWHWRKPEQSVMPLTVEALIELTLSKASYSGSLKKTLESRAYLALEASNQLWQTLTGLSAKAFAGAKAELERQGILHEGNFAHPLYRELCLKLLSTSQRQQYARGAIQALEANPAAAAVYLDDANLDAESTLKLLNQAIQKAKEQKNEALAARLQARVVDIYQGEKKAELAFNAALNLYEYDLNEAIRLISWAHQLKPETYTFSERLALYLAQAGRKLEVENLLDTFSAADRNSSKGLMLEIGVAHYLRNSQQVVAIWKAHPDLHSRAPATTIRNVAFSKADLGQSKAALELCQKALMEPSLSVEEQVLLLETCGFACYTGSDFTKAVQYYSEAIELFRFAGQHHRNGSLLFNRAISLQNLARFQDCLTDAKEALQLAQDSGNTLFFINAQLAIGIASLELGHFEETEKLFLDCEAYYAKTGMTTWLIDVNLGLSDLYTKWQTPYAGVLARKHAEKAWHLAKQLNNRRYLAGASPYTVMAETLYGDPQSANKLAEAAEALCSEEGDRQSLCRVLYARVMILGLIGQAKKARALAQRALELAQNLAMPLEAAKIRLEIAHLSKDKALAQTVLEWFEAGNLQNGIKLVRQYFPELNHEPSPDHAPIKASLHLKVLGDMRLSISGQDQAIRGKKRQQLLALLLEARLSGRSELDRLSLLDALYPGIPEVKALGSLKQLIHALRLEFGESIVKTLGTGYALGDIDSDAEQFLKTGHTPLWQGPYLESPSFQETVAESLHLFLYESAQPLLESEPKEVARVCRFLLDYDPYNLNYLALSLKALQQMDNQRSLLRMYEQAKKRFAEMGETLPETWTELLSPPVFN
ncbi:MAG: hypothetical protein KC422_04515 [Trueperaceae bacterium]|nr:hypothetical protein [Trueperaceae bacterium]